MIFFFSKYKIWVTFFFVRYIIKVFRLASKNCTKSLFQLCVFMVENLIIFTII